MIIIFLLNGERKEREKKKERKREREAKKREIDHINIQKVS